MVIVLMDAACAGKTTVLGPSTFRPPTRFFRNE